MSRSKLLTREMLENYGITNITEDGQVFMGEKVIKINVAQKKGKYKLQQPYARILIADKSRKVTHINKKGKEYWTYAAVTILLNRAVYAWYHGEVPAGLEVDHIDENTLNNHISNLRVLTKEENLARKPISRNQYNYWKTDEEILAERANRRYVYDRSQHKLVQTDWWIEQKEQQIKENFEEKLKEMALKSFWHSLNAEIKEKQAARRAVDKTTDMTKWRKLGIEIDILKMSLAETRQKLNK